MRAAIATPLMALAIACTPQPPPRRGADGGLAMEGAPAPAPGPEAEAADGGRAGAPAVLPLLSAEAVLRDGSAVPLSRDAVTAVDPSARFRVEVGARLSDARLSLLDGQDAMVPSDGTTEATATTRFTLAPSAPLRPGSSYTLRLEGAEGRLLAGQGGGTWEPVSLALRTTGAAPAPQRKAKRRRGR
ncbi:MAG TPA: hypothetical protein VFF02_13165 [Anaeromyxobacteraceae bacterium]|nr:hypothetical protein [Anaeromyxobacteraceae bacterium]